MEDDERTEMPSEKGKNKKDRAALVVAAVLVLAIIICVVLLVVRLSDRGKDMWEDWQETISRDSEDDRKDDIDLADDEDKEDKEDKDKDEDKSGREEEKEANSGNQSENDNVQKEYTLKQVSFEIVKVLREDAYLAVEDELYGIVDGMGNWLVEPAYEYVDYYDEELVCFSDYDYYTHVYDVKGNLLDTYNGRVGNLVNEDGSSYNMYTHYRRGMKIELIIGNENPDYYGARYYNAETGELIFEAVGSYEDIALNSLPDETGTAVVICCDKGGTLVYRINKDGYSLEKFILRTVATREFYYSSFINWMDRTMSYGWLKTTIAESESALLYPQEYREVLYNIETNEIVPLPDQYQDYAAFYTHSRGLYYGITTLTEEEYYGEYPEVMYYAICHGSDVLTDEIYEWIDFGEKYIIAGNSEKAHILDYSGNVLAEYKDIGAPFVYGRTLVFDGKGVFYIDEDLNEYPEYILENRISYCQPVSVWKSGASYLIQWKDK